jgi:hypothetical protein
MQAPIASIGEEYLSSLIDPIGRSSKNQIIDPRKMM